MLCATGMTITAPVALMAQNEAAVQGPTINFGVRPRYAVDPQRLKRRPIIDGVISANEWDPLYTITDGAVKGTVYLNWDDEFLYVAVRTDQPAQLVFDLDCNADGWLHGADNLELVLGPSSEGPAATVVARILDAAGSKDAPVWNEKVVDTKSIQSAQKTDANGWTLEFAIPRGIAGLAPRTGATLSVRADLVPSTVVVKASAPYEPHLLLDVNLVESRTISAPGMTPRLTIEDTKLIPGQPLKATLELISQTEEEVRVRSITWQGDGAAADIMNTLKDVNVPSVKGLKSGKVKYNSPLSATSVPGYYQMTVTVQLENGKTVSSTASFSIVEPFNLQISTDPEIINVLGPTQVKAIVEIFSAVPGYARGEVEIEAPAAWEVKGRKKKEFYVAREDSTVKSPFFMTLPSATAAGDYVLNATISYRGKTWKVHKNIHVSRSTDAPPAAAPGDAAKKP